MSSQSPLEFNSHVRVGRRAAWVLVPSLLMLAGATVIFFLMLLTPTSSGSGALPGMLGGLVALPIMGLGYGYILLRSPVRVVLDDTGLTVFGLISARRFAWSDIAELRRDRVTDIFANWNFAAGKAEKKDAMKHVVSLRNARGKELAALTDMFVDFPGLVAEIEARSWAARGQPTYRREADLARRIKKQRRTARIMAVGGGFFALASAVAAPFMWTEYRDLQRFDQQAIEARGRIVTHRMYNVTPRVVYEFTDATGTRHERDAEMIRRAWEGLEVGDSVAVRYLPDKPQVSRLAQGEPAEDAWLRVAPLVVLPLFLLLSASFPIMVLCGYADLKTKDGKLKLVRLGEIDDALGEAAGATEYEAAILDETADAQYEPFADPSDKYSAPAAALELETPAMPAGIKAIAIINIIFGLLCVISSVGKIVFMIWFTSRGKMIALGDRVFFFELTDAEIRLAYLGHAIDLILALLLAVSAFGLLRLRPWGRWMALFAAYGQIVSSLIPIAVTIASLGAAAPEVAPQTGFAMRLGFIGGILWCVVGMVYPVIVAIALQRKSARERFRSATRSN